MRRYQGKQESVVGKTQAPVTHSTHVDAPSNFPVCFHNILCFIVAKTKQKSTATDGTSLSLAPLSACNILPQIYAPCNFQPMNRIEQSRCSIAKSQTAIIKKRIKYFLRRRGLKSPFIYYYQTSAAALKATQF